MYLGRALERLGDAALKEQEPDIGAAFLKFAVVTKELSALMKTLVRVNIFTRDSITIFRSDQLYVHVRRWFNDEYLIVRSSEKFLSFYKEIMDAQHFSFHIILSNYV